jgi:hypothetical protein
MQTSKHLFALAFLAFASLGFAEDAIDTLNEAQRAYVKGEATLARRKFARVLELDPGNVTATRYIKVIDAEVARARANQPPPSIAEERVSRVTLPKIELREATLAETLEYLQQKCRQILGDDKPINMVLLLSEEARARKITLTLANVPAAEVFRYIANLGNVEFSYDEYAMIVKDKNTVRATSPKPRQNLTYTSLAEVRLPKAEFREATLAESLEYLAKKTVQLTNQRVAPNFVMQLDDAAKAAKFTLVSLDLPLTEILRYIGELTKVDFSYEQFAIAVRPHKEPAPPAAKAGEAEPGVLKIPGLN